MEQMHSIHTIVITGGPCAGKTTAMSWLQNALTDAGYAVMFIPETCTDLNNSGVTARGSKTNYEFQRVQVRYQLLREQIYRQAAEASAADEVVVVCDRGSMDDKPYMTADEFASILKELGQNEVAFRDKYDAVFHMVTAAKGAEAFYTTDNNTARVETLQEAIELDERTLAAWAGHPHLRIIDNSTDFNGKLVRLLREVMTALGKPAPFEHARRFLIDRPDRVRLETHPACRRVEIIQTYLTDVQGEKRRICMRGNDGSYIYYMTTHCTGTDGSRIETEKRLSLDDYQRLMMEADPMCMPIRKTRYCLVEDGRAYEVDFYPNWKDCAMLQVEMNDPNAEVHIPANFRVQREVTDDPEYQNFALAKIR